MKTYIIADVHGEFEKLLACLKAVNFDYEKDKLIQLGDVVDRGANSYKVVKELLKIKNLVAIRGNHDATWMESIETGQNILYSQGGRETLLSYTRDCNCDGDPTKIPVEHQLFFKNQKNYYIDEDNNLFIHGGFNRHETLQEQEEESSNFYWDRDLFLSALSYESMKDHTHKFKYKQEFNTIFVGHTPTTYWDSLVPMKAANIINLDTGCGKGGLLTIMNLQTKEYFQF